MAESPKYSVSDFIAVANHALDYTFPDCVVYGEVANFNVNQNRWIFFDLKDQESVISCFMVASSLRMPIENGMKIAVQATPKIFNRSGRFTLTIKQYALIGEGNIKKAYELLKAKLTKEGLFDPARKRSIPANLERIGVISSTQAAGYADFIKIINARWGGLEIRVANTKVQGLGAADQVIRALDFFNQENKVQIIAIIRGGGSKEDLACFDDEKLVRAIAASKIPIITGIGHEIDTSLADLAADIVASTPSNTAEMLSKDKKLEIANLYRLLSRAKLQIERSLDAPKLEVKRNLLRAKQQILNQILRELNQLKSTQKVIENLNPETILKKGYAILKGELKIDSEISLETLDSEISARVTKIKSKERKAHD